MLYSAPWVPPHQRWLTTLALILTIYTFILIGAVAPSGFPIEYSLLPLIAVLGWLTLIMWRNTRYVRIMPQHITIEVSPFPLTPSRTIPRQSILAINGEHQIHPPGVHHYFTAAKLRDTYEDIPLIANLPNHATATAHARHIAQHMSVIHYESPTLEFRPPFPPYPGTRYILYTLPVCLLIKLLT